MKNERSMKVHAQSGYNYKAKETRPKDYPKLKDYQPTAGNDRHSIAFELHTKAIDILEGRRVDPTFYPVVYGLKDDGIGKMKPTGTR